MPKNAVAKSAASKHKSQPRAAAQPNKKRHVVARRAGARNDYLATLLDPWGVHGVGIPDFDTQRASRINTKHRVRVTVNNGLAMYAIKPALKNGIFKVGQNPAGRIHSILNGPLALAGATAAELSDVVSQVDLTLFQEDFLLIRPVSFGVKVVCTQALLNAQGEIAIVPYVPSRGVPFQLDTVASLPGGLSDASGPFPAALPTTAPTFTQWDDVVDAAEQENSFLKEVACPWTPELPNNLSYQAVGGTGGDPGGSLDQSGTDSVGWWRVRNHNVALGEVDEYVSPAPVTQMTTVEGAPSFDVHGENLLPCLVVVFQGCTITGANIAELLIEINWEAVPRPGLQTLLPTLIQPANPLELAQASNVLQAMPKVFYPNNPEEPGTASRAVIEETCGMLYDDKVPTKVAVEGTSIWSKIKKAASSVLGTISKGLGAAPGVPGMIGQGAGILSSILSN